MKIVEPKVELWLPKNEDQHIARCARVCYASDTSDNKKLCQALWKNKHWSMYRHMPTYYIIPESISLPDIAFIDFKRVLHEGSWYCSTNMQTTLEYLDKYAKYRISYFAAVINNVFFKNKLLRYTFAIDTGIDITREFNRKSPNNIAEQSTRYVDFIKKVGIRFKKCHWMWNLNLYKKFLVYMMCKTSEWFYKLSRSKYGLNLPPEDARWILPVDTMSKVAYTYTVQDWEHIINLRYFGITGRPHKDAKIVAAKIKHELEILGYTFNDLNK